MIRNVLAGVVVLTLLVFPVSAQDARTVLAAASKAMGVDGLKTVQFSATGYDFALGQAPNGNSPWPKFINKTYTRAIDFEARASRVERVRLQGENPPRGGGQQPIAGEQPANQTIVVSANTPWVQQLEIVMLPHGFLRMAAARNATVETRTVNGKRYNILSFTGDNKARVSGYIDDRNFVERVETTIDNAFFGDIAFDAIYTDYRDVGSGAKFPGHIVQRQGGYPIFDLTMTEVKANEPVTIQAQQGGRGGAAGPAASAPAAPPTEKLSDGVFLILGGYVSIAVDGGDHITIVELGQSEERGNAVIAAAKSLIPGKPVTRVINTHPHVDHGSGLRAAVAEGATILTHDSNRGYLEKVLSQPHTLNPDRAQQTGKKPIVQGVGDKRVLDEGGHAIELHHMKNFGHHDGMLLVYLPKEKVLFQADAYNPQPLNAVPLNPPSPYTLSLVDHTQRLKLDVQRIVPVHYPADNRVVTLAEVTKWVGRSN